ncbi:MAG: sigma-70 family RNA polymerase sigma factor [Prevotella sp.]|nr:sigma-70 family RNA polymerase sigma factor [Prevotella sp.]
MSKTVSKQEFALLVREHARQVIDFAQRIVTDREDAEEVAQDAFVKAFHSLSSFRGDSSPLTWLLRIAYHEALNSLRRRRPYMVDIEAVSVGSELGLLTADGDDDELTAEREVRIRLMEEAIDLLPPADQLLLHLYYYDDRPLRDIAYIMDAEPNALGVRLHRIRKKLQTMIKQREDE